ncbi:hypothetical protein IRJ41_003539 [Triplophysa rosa]|uniref:Integrase core domain-containing protein n=1 Tax=Triplophysa rosa TaxID=992332 RepID=A0A9W7WH02_TRIRA|nr:hypothetical protein IRJ41_003539 [Triplophysa rosa]
MDMTDEITFFFNLGMSYKDIVRSLALIHGKVISERTLKRLLKSNGLCRRKYADLNEIIGFIIDQLNGPGRLHGYRWMHTKCLEHGIRARKEDVRIILKELDPESSLLRQRRRLHRRRYFSQGPNYIWHVDSYDKLKPYGICINGCIDGFSRRIIWLKAAHTNSNPQVIAGYFVESVMNSGGCPRVIRCDLGTENVIMRDIQMFFRRNDGDERAGPRSCITGVSSANQRIESWWGLMRKEGIEFWIQFFGELKDEGLFAGDFLDKALLQLCFRNIIQEQLDDIATVWNAHRIRPSANCNVPCGIPNIMFMAPQLWGTEDFIVQPDSDLQIAQEACMFLSAIPCDEEVFDLCTILMEEQNLRFPSDRREAFELYVELRDAIRSQITE